MEAKLLSPNYFKKKMLVPPSGFQSVIEENKTAVLDLPHVSKVTRQQQQQQQGRLSIHRDVTDVVQITENASSECLLQSEVSMFSTPAGNRLSQVTPMERHVPSQPYQSGTKRSLSELQVQTVPREFMHSSSQTSVTRREADSPSTGIVTKKLKTVSTNVQTTYACMQPQRVLADDGSNEDTVGKLLITAEEAIEYNNNSVVSPESNVAVIPEHAESPSEEQQKTHTEDEKKTSGDVVASVSLQYDNYFKYAAGRCAIATTKQGWEFAADSEEDTEIGEVLFRRSLANKLATADKHLKYIDSVERRKENAGVRAREPEPALSAAAQPIIVTTPTIAQSANYSSVATEFVPPERHVARYSEPIEADFETTAPASLKSIEFETSRSLSSGDWSLNDLSQPDEGTPPSNGSCVELFSSRSEEIPNTSEIRLLHEASQPVTPPPRLKEREVRKSREEITGGGSFHPKLEIVREGRGVAKMASSGLQVDTQNDILIARVLQSEEESRSACGYGQSRHEFGDMSDREMAEQLQLELDREMAQQIHYEEEQQQQQQQQHGYREHDSYHPSYNPYPTTTRSEGRGQFDNNGQSHYIKPSDRRRHHYEQGHPHHLDRGHHRHMMHPLQEHGHDQHHHHYGSGHRMAGSIETVHPLHYPGGHGHLVEEEMDMTYEALLELEDVSRGLDEKTVSRLTTLCEYEPSQASSSAASRSCSICLSDFEKGQMVRSLPCFHSFHCHCIDRWLETNKLCPVCQTELQPNNS